MPRKRRQMRGAGLKSWLMRTARSVNNFLKKHKILSRGSRVYGNIPMLPYSGIVGKASPIFGKMGYGMKTKSVGYGMKPCKRKVGRRAVSMRSSGLKRAGMGLTLAGGRSYTRTQKRKPRRRYKK